MYHETQPIWSKHSNSVVVIAEITHTTDMACWALFVLAFAAFSQVSGKSSPWRYYV